MYALAKVKLLDLDLLFVAGAWGILLLLQQTNYAIYLNHGDWTKVGLLASICGFNLEQGWIAGGLGFLSSWLLMLVAMMGPIAFVNLRHQGRMSAGAVLGYAVPWLLAGLAFHAFGYLLQSYAQTSPFLFFNGWIIGAIMLLAIGLYQLSPMKSQKMISRFSSLRSSFIEGLRYGLNCVRHCGPLMCLMFLFFPGSLLWMAVITGLITLDSGSFGMHKLHNEIGIVLIVTAAILTVVNTV